MNTAKALCLREKSLSGRKVGGFTEWREVGLSLGDRFGWKKTISLHTRGKGTVKWMVLDG